MDDAATLRSRLCRKPILVAPGVYDPFTALIASKSGFSTLYVSGAAIAYTKLGRPDVGLVSMTEVTNTLALIRDRVDSQLIVDADTGYGNALNVVRTVREFERAGANAIQLEDQDFPKRCGHLDGKLLIPAAEMCGKIRAALDARRSGDTLVIARTDAVAVEGFDRALERAAMYREAGADMLFVEAPRTRDDLARMIAALGTSLPLMANMVEGGKTPTLPATELEAIGFALAIFPGAIVRALGYMASEFYGSLAAHGSNEPYRNRMLDFAGLNELIDTPEMIALGQKYEAPARPPDQKPSGNR
ncbi:MAG: isocitrate lyase/PEP mutase family protein [Alphaproteobacteria bacterium]|nr:isocitrate lyase/PEP mutase family protein [Alphaproteobacteria bacterium]